MSEEAVAGRYARAIYELGKEKDALDAFESDLNALSEAIGGSKDFMSFLQHPGIDLVEKKRILKSMLAGNISEDVLSLTLLLLESRRIAVLSGVAREFTALYNKARNLVDATIYTVTPLDGDEQESISSQFGKTIGKTMRTKNQIDPSIIGGLIIRIGDRLYDGSVSGKLNRFKQALVHS